MKRFSKRFIIVKGFQKEVNLGTVEKYFPGALQAKLVSRTANYSESSEKEWIVQFRFANGMIHVDISRYQFHH